MGVSHEGQQTVGESHGDAQPDKTKWDTLDKVEFAGDKVPDGAELRSGLDELKPIYAELVYAQDLAPKVREFSRDFGIDALAKRYGIGRVMEAVARQAEAAEQESVTDSNVAKVGAKAISGVYQEVEPDVKKRKALLDSIIVGENASEWVDGKRISSRLQSDKNGNIIVAENSESSNANGTEAWDGIAAMREFSELITGGRVEGTYMFQDVRESLGNGDAPDDAGGASEVMTEGIERPGVNDLVDKVESRMGDSLSEMYRRVNDLRQKVFEISEQIRAEHPDATEDEIRSETELYLSAHGGDSTIVEELDSYELKIRDMKKKWNAQGRSNRNEEYDPWSEAI